MFRPRAASPRARRGWGIGYAAARRGVWCGNGTCRGGAIGARVDGRRVCWRPRTRRRAKWAGLMGQIDMHLLGCQLQVDGGHSPGVFDAQNAPVQLTIFHGDWIDTPLGCTARPAERGSTMGSAERFETPSCGGSRPFLAAWGEPARPGLGIEANLEIGPVVLAPGGGNGKGGVKLPCCRRQLAC
jgi:hypothetical protein